MDCRVIASLLICLAFVSISTEAEHVAPEPPPAPCHSLELRCRCIQTQRRFIPYKHIHHLEMIPAGAHCEQPEVIVTMKGGKWENRMVCVDPKAKWVQALIDFAAKRTEQKK